MRGVMVAALLCAAACATSAPGARFVMPTGRIEKVTGLALDATHVTLHAVLRVDNPNIFPIHLEKVSYVLELDHKTAGDGETTAPLQVPARGSATAPMDLRTPHREALAAGAALLLLGKVPYTLRMTAHLSTPVGPVGLPILDEGVVELRNGVPVPGPAVH